MRARAVVVGMVLALALAGFNEAEWWPVSSMRLFSQMRDDRSSAYEVRLVHADGTEEVLAVSRLGRGFRGAHHLLPRFGSMTQAERDDVCSAWARAAGSDADHVRIDVVTRTVPTGPDDPRREVGRREAWTCAAGP